MISPTVNGQPWATRPANGTLPNQNRNSVSFNNVGFQNWNLAVFKNFYPAERHRVQFTATRVQVDKLRDLQALLSHAVPNGDLAVVVERADGTIVRRRRVPVFGLEHGKALIERDRGNTAAARRWAEEILRVNPTDQAARQLLQALPSPSE